MGSYAYACEQTNPRRTAQRYVGRARGKAGPLVPYLVPGYGQRTHHVLRMVVHYPQYVSTPRLRSPAVREPEGGQGCRSTHPQKKRASAHLALHQFPPTPFYRGRSPASLGRLREMPKASSTTKTKEAIDKVIFLIPCTPLE